MKPASRQKIRAYKRHWAVVHSIQEEMWAQYIHQGLKLNEVATEAQLTFSTTKRFLHYGRGNGKMGYSFFHGPALTTVVGISGALGLDLKLEKRKPNGGRK